MTILEEPIKEPLEVKNYIDGFWVESEGEYKDVVNPATGKTIARVPISTGEELNEAVEAAREAFPVWREVPPLARARCMMRLKNLLEE
ncbi:MAG: aldehyde dehydrogenase family protein, partial [Anaerolineae bacterium]